ncbi:MAG: histidine--tRNA ligase [Nitriliruptoraceae bacterium]
MATIDANPPAGTRDHLPVDVERRERAFDTIRRVFRSHGFSPLETPAFERLEVLTGKYGDEGDQLIFKILRRGEHEATGVADLALRYDLTVPLARVVARYGSQLPNPFRRYQIAPVWRADRPGRGRFREFHQCDLDTVGSSSLTADATTIIAVADALEALGLHGFRVQVNHREALRGLIEAYGVPAEFEADTLVALDKLAKIGVDGVATELRDRGIPPPAAEAITADLTDDDALRARVESTSRGATGTSEVDRLVQLVGDVVGGTVEYAPVLARGLSYYTGPVFEVVHDDLDVTIAAGGRYDGLVGMFQSTDVPATGGSLGLERILLLLEDRETEEHREVDVVVTVVDEALTDRAVALAGRVRRTGLRVDLYSGEGRLGKQLKYADRRGAAVALILGDQEIDTGTVTIKHLATGDQIAVATDDLDERVVGLCVDTTKDDR